MSDFLPKKYSEILNSEDVWYGLKLLADAAALDENIDSNRGTNYVAGQGAQALVKERRQRNEGQNLTSYDNKATSKMHKVKTKSHEGLTHDDLIKEGRQEVQKSMKNKSSKKKTDVTNEDPVSHIIEASTDALDMGQKMPIRRSMRLKKGTWKVREGDQGLAYDDLIKEGRQEVQKSMKNKSSKKKTDVTNEDPVSHIIEASTDALDMGQKMPIRRSMRLKKGTWKVREGDQGLAYDDLIKEGRQEVQKFMKNKSSKK